jgi:hypothetical protein
MSSLILFRGSGLRHRAGGGVTGTVRAFTGSSRTVPAMTQAAADRLDAAWRVLALVGVALLASAVATLLPGWLSPRFGNVDWEFAAMAEVAAVLPLAAIGMGGWLAAAVGLRRRKTVLGLGVGFVVVGLVLIGCLLLFATTAVIAVQNTQGSPLPMAVGVKRLVARTAWSLALGILGCAAASVAAFRISSTSRNQNRA